MFPLQTKQKVWWKFCEKVIYGCKYFQSDIDIFGQFYSLQSIFYMYLFATEEWKNFTVCKVIEEQFNNWPSKPAYAILHLPFLSCYRSRVYTLCVRGNNFFCKLPWRVRKYLRCICTYKWFYIQTFWMVCCIKPSSQATFCRCGYCQRGADMRNSATTGACSSVHILYTSHYCLQNLILQ